MNKNDTSRLICRCEEITLSEVEQAIDEGFVTVREIRRRTRAGMGLCQGRTCGKLIARIISEKIGMPLSEIDPELKRPPARPVRMDSFDIVGSSEIGKNNGE